MVPVKDSKTQDTSHKLKVCQVVLKKKTEKLIFMSCL